MRGGTIWEREIKWPKTGPIRWLTMYVFFMAGVGFALWFVLSLGSPTAPDPASGKIYEVEGGRRRPPFYVDRIDAYALRFTGAHLALIVLVGGGVGLWNAGARVPKKPDEPDA